jgi:hypothetical protein
MRFQCAIESTFGARRVGAVDGRGWGGTTPVVSTRTLSGDGDGDGAIGAAVPNATVTGGATTSLASFFA